MKVFQLYQWQCVLCTELLLPMPNRPDDVLATGKARFYHPGAGYLQQPGAHACPNRDKEVWVSVPQVELEDAPQPADYPTPAG